LLMLVLMQLMMMMLLLLPPPLTPLFLLIFLPLLLSLSQSLSLPLLPLPLLSLLRRRQAASRRGGQPAVGRPGPALPLLLLLPPPLRVGRRHEGVAEGVVQDGVAADALQAAIGGGLVAHALQRVVACARVLNHHWPLPPSLPLPLPLAPLLPLPPSLSDD
jgi:hypothetical protein